MIKLYIDTKIFFDIIIDRDLEKISIEKLKKYFKNSCIYMSALSVHIIFYTLKIKPNTLEYERIKGLIKIINIVPLSHTIINKSINNFSHDFEDTLQYFSAIESNCEYILTRDKKDFTKIKKAFPSKIEIVSSVKNIK